MTKARLGLAAGFFALAALALCLPSRPRGASPQVMPDGTVVRLASISYGRIHRIATGNFLHRTLGPLLTYVCRFNPVNPLNKARLTVTIASNLYVDVLARPTEQRSAAT